MSIRRARFLTTLIALMGPVAACAAPASDGSQPQGGPSVVVTTGILADLVTQVTGDRAEVTSLVPPTGDPHSYEPSLRDIRSIVYADAAFSNYLLLEQHSVVRSLDANLRDGVPNIALAESATKYAARVIPLVENVSLDMVWLGVRVNGTGADQGADRSAQVVLRATDIAGPGQLTAYLTETFGNPRVYVDSADARSDNTVVLPVDAHTHMSWTFAQAGVYQLTVNAVLEVRPETEPIELDEQVITFAVGIDPHTVPGMSGAQVLREGHADLTVDLDAGTIGLVADEHVDGHNHQHLLDPGTTVVEVPNSALSPIPASPDFRFLGRPGTSVFQLPQAVLGRHIHGEIDPHLWHDVRNVIAYVQVIRDTLIGVDPQGAPVYRANADAYIDELHELDEYMSTTLAKIPEHRRHLITTHDAFGYLASAYDLRIAGFVTPNPAAEPSLAERHRLSETIRNLDVPAVFLEPTLVHRSPVLRDVAEQHDIAVCPILSDAFTPEIATYVDLMRFNADSLHRCLTVDR